METHGKGKPYTRVDPIKCELTVSQFQQRFGQIFQEYVHHIVPSWYLTNVKHELQKCRDSRASTLFITSDFAENILIVRKYELSDQYFHRNEILLYGAVASYVKTEVSGELVPHQSSYMVSSDYR